MAQALRSGFHSSIASTVLSDIQFKRSNLYSFLGKVERWDASDTVPTTVPADTVRENAIIRSNAVYFKKIQPSDASLVISRYDWVTGQTWVRWDDSKDLDGQKFYCVSPENGQYLVYKCLDNGVNAYGTIPASTVKPAGKDLHAVRYSDGYVWKFMYEIPAFKYTGFASTTYIPVQRSLSDYFYGTGALHSLTVLANGMNYSAASTTITISGDGTGATAIPIIAGGQITGATIVTPGTGYTYATATVNSTSGAGASLSVNFVSNDFISTQSVVEQVAVPGEIWAWDISNPGTNYTAGTTISVVGDGVGATVTPAIINGAITKLTVDNPGSGYTWAELVITSPGRVTAGAQNLAATPIHSPNGGHGYDAVSELYGVTLVINSLIKTDQLLTKVAQNYRQFGLISNPKHSITFDTFRDDYQLAVYDVMMSTTSGLQMDEVLVFNNVKYRVVYFSGLNTKLQKLSPADVSPSGTGYAEASASRTYSINQILSFPTVNKFSGSLLYVSNENPFTVTSSQGIVIKTYIRF